MSSLATGNVETGTAWHGSGEAAASSTSRSSSNATARAGSPWRGHDGRVQLARRARRARRRPWSAARSGRGATARGRRRPDARSSTPTTSATSRAAAIASVWSARRPVPHQPAGSRWPARTPATRRGCGGTAASIAASCVVGRAHATGQPRRSGRVRDRAGDQTELEDRHVARATADVAPGGVEQGDQEVRPQERLLVGQRVDQPDRAAAVVVGGQPERVELLGAHERVAEHLDQPGLGQRAGDRTAGPLTRRQARARRRRRARSTGSRRTRAGGRPPRPGRRRTSEVGPPGRCLHAHGARRGVG